MENPASLLETLFEKAEAFGKTTYRLSKLKSMETTIHVATSLLSRLVVLLIFSLFILVLNIGIALWLGQLLGESYFGFFIVAAFYLLAGIILHFFLHKWIKKPIAGIIISQALK